MLSAVIFAFGLASASAQFSPCSTSCASNFPSLQSCNYNGIPFPSDCGCGCGCSSLQPIPAPCAAPIPASCVSTCSAPLTVAAPTFACVPAGPPTVSQANLNAILALLGNVRSCGLLPSPGQQGGLIGLIIQLLQSPGAQSNPLLYLNILGNLLQLSIGGGNGTATGGGLLSLDVLKPLLSLNVLGGSTNPASPAGSLLGLGLLGGDITGGPGPVVPGAALNAQILGLLAQLATPTRPASGPCPCGTVPVPLQQLQTSNCGCGCGC